MFRFLFYKKKLLQSSVQTLRIQCFQNPLSRFHSQATPPSALAQYIQNTCGLSPEEALKACQRLKNRYPRNMDSVLSFLKSQGFSETHIKSIVTRAPSILAYAAPGAKMLPKVEFLREKGLSNTEVLDLMALNPVFLLASLEDSIKPSVGIISSILGRDELLIEFLKHEMHIYLCSDRVVLNATVLKEYGVPNHLIAKLLTQRMRAFNINPNQFQENVKMIKEMDFDPSTFKFLAAVEVKARLSNLSWETKFRVYRSCGWSDDQILSAFRREPKCMMISEEKIIRGMDYFVKELGWAPSYISVYPHLLMLSLEKRIIARHKFLQVLVSMRLIPTHNIANSFIMNDEQFLKKYVLKYQFPDMLKVYETIIRVKGRA
ncbi:hypothetical protein ACLOJK_025009 [Asimina triloba]